MTLKYRLIRGAVRAAKLKNRLAGDIDELVESSRKQNEKTKIPELKDEAFDISRIDVMGFPVLKFVHKQRTEKADMFIIGGGMVSMPKPAAVRKALMIAKEAGIDMVVPYYPLCTDYPITKAYEMIHETYKVMLKDYAAENISILGSSSGGNLALGAAPYINDGHGDTPMPGHIIALSPGTCVDTDEEWQRMLELDKKDVVTPSAFMRSVEKVMRHGDDTVPDYMLRLQKADYTGVPKVTFFYGSDENLYAYAPSFEAAMKKYGVDFKIIVGEGMFHCYPMFPLCREAQEGRAQMISALKE